MSAIEEWRPVVGFEGIFASWMATADGCDCGNLQPPKVVIPSTLPGMAFHAFYRCADCGKTWTRAYPPTRKEAAA